MNTAPVAPERGRTSSRTRPRRGTCPNTATLSPRRAEQRRGGEGPRPAPTTATSTASGTAFERLSCGRRGSDVPSWPAEHRTQRRATVSGHPRPVGRPRAARGRPPREHAPQERLGRHRVDDGFAAPPGVVVAHEATPSASATASVASRLWPGEAGGVSHHRAEGRGPLPGESRPRARGADEGLAPRALAQREGGVVAVDRDFEPLTEGPALGGVVRAQRRTQKPRARR